MRDLGTTELEHVYGVAGAGRNSRSYCGGGRGSGGSKRGSRKSRKSNKHSRKGSRRC